MRVLTAKEVHARKIEELGLDPDALDLNTPEGIAGALRRAASHLCPCPPATLVRAVVRPLRGLVVDLDSAKELVEQTLDAMVAYGDLLQQKETHSELSSQRVLIYAAPLRFVARESGLVFLVGIAADDLSPLSPELARRVQHLGHIRRLAPQPPEDLASELKALGLTPLNFNVWVRLASAMRAADFIAIADKALDGAAPCREIQGLVLLDPSKPVRFYPARWERPNRHTGRFVARREQAYGADLWCYVEMRNGTPARMVDLPMEVGYERGCDGGWRLQAAIDASRGTPQLFRVRSGQTSEAVLELFSPVPGWAKRRWDALGEPVKLTGSLFAYRIPSTELAQERRFARDELWLDELPPNSR